MIMHLELGLLDEVIGKILQVHDKVVIGMDANSRNVIWDNNCLGTSFYRKSIRMGVRLEEILHKNIFY